MIFPSFYPGNLTGTWVGGQFTLDQAITVLRIAAVAKTPTGATCPAAVFRLTNSTKGQDLVLTPGQNWSDTGAMVMTFNAGDVLQASLRTGSTCASNTGADANLLVEYKMQAQGDTDACSGTSCNGFCTSFSSDPSNCGTCGTACPTGQACTNGACPGNCTGGQVFCNGACTNEQTDNNNCGACGNICKSGGSFCAAGACVALLPNGGACNAGAQCLSGNCTGGICTAACGAGQVLCNGACVNEQTDPNNCGGCSIVCISGQSCNAGACVGQPIGGPCSGNAACASNVCDLVTSKCVGSLCVDQRQDGAETDIDCGGGTCTACGVGKKCQANTDCTTNACDFVTGLCAVSTCSDQRKDGNETDVDCGGGGACATCAIGKGCQLDTDCSSNACNAATSTCVSNQCADNRKDGAETDVDCGGGICSACTLGLHCGVDNDCSSNACDAISFTCVSNQCSDHQKDGTETDIDCGGSNSCARCSVGQACLISSDCSIGHTCNVSSKLCQ
jgi:hypothetical protein